MFGGVFDALYDEPGSIYIANRFAHLLAIISFPVPVKRYSKLHDEFKDHLQQFRCPFAFAGHEFTSRLSRYIPIVSIAILFNVP
jgi:hypothetical protein